MDLRLKLFFFSGLFLLGAGCSPDLSPNEGIDDSNSTKRPQIASRPEQIPEQMLGCWGSKIEGLDEEYVEISRTGISGSLLPKHDPKTLKIGPTKQSVDHVLREFSLSAKSVAGQSLAFDYQFWMEFDDELRVAGYWVADIAEPDPGYFRCSEE